MWSCVCFTTYLLHFQLKNFRGNIFSNSNYSAISDVLAVVCCGTIYSKVGLKVTYYISFTLGLVGALSILYLEVVYNNPAYREIFYEWMPILCFLAKFGTAMGFLNSYFASYLEESIFSPEKRATAIGICNLVARGIGAFAPMLNELHDPTPISMVCVVLVIGICVTTNLNIVPSRNDAKE